MSESKHTPGPWFVSGVRFRMNGGEWHSINRYDEAKKQDENIACVGFDPRNGAGLTDARLIAAAPDLLEACKRASAILRGDGAPGWGVAKDILNTAIARAEGR